MYSPLILDPAPELPRSQRLPFAGASPVIRLGAGGPPAGRARQPVHPGNQLRL